jgi:type II secretory pathway pseudopilin PulG
MSRKESGFSLVQTMVALGIASVAALGLSQYILQTRKAARTVEQSLEVADVAGLVFRLLAHEDSCRNYFGGKRFNSTSSSARIANVQITMPPAYTQVIAGAGARVTHDLTVTRLEVRRFTGFADDPNRFNAVVEMDTTRVAPGGAAGTTIPHEFTIQFLTDPATPANNKRITSCYMSDTLTETACRDLLGNWDPNRTPKCEPELNRTMCNALGGYWDASRTPKCEPLGDALECFMHGGIWNKDGFSANPRQPPCSIVQNPMACWTSLGKYTANPYYLNFLAGPLAMIPGFCAPQMNQDICAQMGGAWSSGASPPCQPQMTPAMCDQIGGDWDDTPEPGEPKCQSGMNRIACEESGGYWDPTHTPKCLSQPAFFREKGWQWTGFLNSLDRPTRNAERLGWFVVGYNTWHDNGTEDNQIALHLFRPGNGNQDFTWGPNVQSTGWVNDWDGEVSFTCSGNGFITNEYSEHSNSKEDRRYKYTCRTVQYYDNFRRRNATAGRELCEWSGLVNYWDYGFDFHCPQGKLMAGVKSIHRNAQEDRIYNFMCCAFRYRW